MPSVKWVFPFVKGIQLAWHSVLVLPLQLPLTLQLGNMGWGEDGGEAYFIQQNPKRKSAAI